MRLSAGDTCKCKNCGKIVSSISIKCQYCGVLSPAICSKCTRCGSQNFKWTKAGVNVGGAVAGLMILGPIGLVAGGAIGSGGVKCHCLDCGKTWTP